MRYMSLRRFHALVVVLTLALLAGCSSGVPFKPDQGPFFGNLYVGEDAIGDFSFTYTGTGIAGTGILVVNNANVMVAVSGNVNGRSVSGRLRNEDEGSGGLVGNFSSTGHASGTFTFTPVGGTAMLSGTWIADVD
jgi:hypothetical protein